MIHNLRTAYEKSPNPVRRLVGPIVRCLPVRYRYGQVFADTLRLSEVANELDDAALLAIEGQRLARLSEAALQSSYWESVFAASGLPFGPRNTDDLRQLPLLDKETVRTSLDEMTSSAIPASARKWVSTGGTTGEPLGLWLEKDASVMDWAFVVKAWGRAGFQLDDKRVVLRGTRLGRHSQRKLFEYDPLRRELYVSVFDMTEQRLPEIKRRIRAFGPGFLHGYPSALEILGKSYRQSGDEPPQLRALLAVSETVSDSQRQFLEDIFSCRLFSFYGMTERVCFAAECEYSSELHVEPLYGITELVDEHGNVIVESGVRGEIVATGFLSHAVPLIRYKTGDYAVWAKGPCKCGRRTARLAHIDGRCHEYLVGRDGIRISNSALNLHSRSMMNVRRMRLCQREPGLAVLLIEPSNGFAGVDGELILKELARKTEGQLKITLKIVDKIGLSPAGKHCLIESLRPGGERPQGEHRRQQDN